MSIDKARRVLKTYKENNFVASKALRKEGYAASTADHASQRIIKNVIHTVARYDIDQLVNSSEPVKTLLQRVGMSRDDLISEFMYIVKQNKDLTNKLKALQPLLATEGIKWDSDKTLVAPTLNLTIKENESTPQQSDEIELEETNVAQELLCDTSDEDIKDEANTELTPLSQSDLKVEKEAVRPAQNFSDLSTIDISVKELLNNSQPPL